MDKLVLYFPFEQDLKNKDGGEYEFVPIRNYEIKDTSTYVDYNNNILFSKAIGGLDNGDGFYLNKPLQLFADSFTLEFYFFNNYKHTGRFQQYFIISNATTDYAYSLSEDIANLTGPNYNYQIIEIPMIEEYKWNHIKLEFKSSKLYLTINNNASVVTSIEDIMKEIYLEYDFFNQNDFYYIGLGIATIKNNDDKDSSLGIYRDFKLVTNNPTQEVNKNKDSNLICSLPFTVSSTYDECGNNTFLSNNFFPIKYVDILNDFTWQDLFNRALYFDGKTSSIYSINIASVLDFTKSFTISLWVYIDDNMGHNDVIFKFYYNSEIHLQYENDNLMCCYNDITNNCSIRQWNHIGISILNTNDIATPENEAFIYVNGKFIKKFITITTHWDDESLIIGDNIDYDWGEKVYIPSGTNQFNGYIKDFRIYNIAKWMTDKINLNETTNDKLHDFEFLNIEPAKNKDSNLICWMPFSISPTYDECGNEFLTYGNIEIEDTDYLKDFNDKYLFNKAVYFNTDNQPESLLFLNKKGNVIIDYKNDFTISLWLYINKLNQEVYYSRIISTDPGKIFDLYINSNTLEAEFNFKKILPISFEYKQWFHLAFIYNSDEKIIYTYYNGKLVSIIKNIEFDYYRGDEVFSFITDHQFNGYIKDFRIYNIAKWTTSEINLNETTNDALYNFDFPKLESVENKDSSLVYWLPFETSPSYDKCGNEFFALNNTHIVDTSYLPDFNDKCLFNKAVYIGKEKNSVIYLKKNNLSLSVKNNFTISLWFNLNNVTSDIHFILTTDIFNVANWNSNEISIEIPSISDSILISNVIENTWYHLGIVYNYNDKIIFIYYNGKLYKTIENVNFNIDYINNIFLGNMMDWDTINKTFSQINDNESLDGYIKDFRIYNIAKWLGDEINLNETTDYALYNFTLNNNIEEELNGSNLTCCNMPFTDNPTYDEYGNTFLIKGNVEIKDTINLKDFNGQFLFNKAVYFDANYETGSALYLNKPGIIVDVKNDFTISLWVYVNEYNYSSDSIFSTLPGYELDIYLNDESKLWCNIGNNGDEIDFAFGQWNHLGIVYKNNDKIMYIYYNGKLVKTFEEMEFNDAANGERLVIGSYFDADSSEPNGNYLNGYIRDFRIYDIAKWTEEEIDLNETTDDKLYNFVLESDITEEPEVIEQEPEKQDISVSEIIIRKVMKKTIVKTNTKSLSIIEYIINDIKTKRINYATLFNNFNTERLLSGELSFKFNTERWLVKIRPKCLGYVVSPSNHI